MSNAGVASSARKLIPKKLEHDLNIPRYKVSEPAKNVREVFDDSKEKAMYDEMFGGLLNQNRDRPSYLKPSLSVNSSRNDLLKVKDENSGAQTGDNSMIYIKRLEQIEAEAKLLRSTLAKSTLANDELTKENFDCNGDMLSENRQLRNENDALQEELANIHSFLADYGLEWVGPEAAEVAEEGVKDREENCVITKEGLEHGQNLYEKLSRKAQALNEQLRSEPAVAKSTDASAGGIRRGRLVHGAEDKETMKCTFYYNGLMVNRGPFRYNATASYTAFVNDMVDGYFPSEYKAIYPDGVLFDLIDKHDVLFKDGEGGSTDSIAAEDYGKQMKGSQLLNRLPKVVVKNGQIVNIRDEIGERLQGGIRDNANADAKPTEGSSVVKGTAKQPIVLDSPASISGDTTIQIRYSGVAGSGVNVLQAKMFSFDNIRDLALLVCKYHNESSEHKGNEDIAPARLEFRTTYPARKLDLDESFDETGLVPNGTLNVKLL